jgi:hypothetical protein
MAYPLYIVLMDRPRTRSVALLAAAVLAGFATVQLPATTKAASSDKVAEAAFFNATPSPKVAALASKGNRPVLRTRGANGRMMRPVATAGQSPAGYSSWHRL